MQRLLRLIPLLLLIFLFQACDKCADVDCVNGECINGTCACDLGYSSEFCEFQVAPNEVLITRIEILDFPALNFDGEPWDASGNGNPDIVLAVLTGINSEVIHLSPEIFLDAQPGDPIEFTEGMPVVLEKPLNTVSFQLFNYDEGSGLLAGMLYLETRVYHNENGFPSYVDYSFPEDDFAMRVHVLYNY